MDSNNTRLALSLFRQGRQDEAVKYFQLAVKEEPNNPQVYNNLGVALKAQQNLTEAQGSFEKALKLDPNLVDVYYNLGNTLTALGKLQSALKTYHKGLKINPDIAKIHNNLGTVYKKLNKPKKALFHFTKATKINKAYPEAYRNLGLIFDEQREIEKAISAYKKAVQFEPENKESLSNLFPLLREVCRWEEAGKIAAKLDTLPVAEVPFVSVFRKQDPKENFRVAKVWGTKIKDSVAKFKQDFVFNKNNSKQRINIGYVSGDFHNHPVAHLMFDLFRHHNRKQFNIFTYSFGDNDKSFWRRQIEKNSEHFRDIRNKSDLETVRQIYQDKVDVLVDLMGYTKNARLEIFALRPSPIQITWLGFPGTTGADFIDYIIADKIVLPEKDIPFYSETPLYLPCYQMNSTIPKISKNKIKRTDFGLPEKSFVFASFSQTYKIEYAMFSIWMEILKAVPGSILWQLKTNDYFTKNLKKEAKERGINPNRIVFAPKMPKDKHLKRLTLADLELDTFTYNGHTTTSDCLWAGVPVLTLQGNHFASRVSASLLTRMELPELITFSMDEYKKLAIDLATHPTKLRSIRRKLAKKRLTSSLFDARKFTKNLEKLYTKIL